MKTKNRLLIMGFVLMVSSKALASQNPYTELHQAQLLNPEKLRLLGKPTKGVQIIHSNFSLEKHKELLDKGYLQIGMLNFKAPPNPNEEKEVRLQAKRIGAELVYIVSDGKHPNSHFILFYGTRKPEYMSPQMRNMRGN